MAVRLLVGCWAHSKAAMFPFLRSLAAIADNATRFSAEVSSPPSFCAAGRTPDLNAVLGVIDAAQQFISVAVMSYLPATEFRRPDRSCQPRG